MGQVSVHFSDKLLAQLREGSEQRGIPVAEYIRFLVMVGLREGPETKSFERSTLEQWMKGDVECMLLLRLLAAKAYAHDEAAREAVLMRAKATAGDYVTKLLTERILPDKA